MKIKELINILNNLNPDKEFILITDEKEPSEWIFCDEIVDIKNNCIKLNLKSNEPIF